MDIEQSNIILSIVSVKLDSKKISNPVLDQIPRLDFVDLLVDKHSNFSDQHVITPVCRFSLTLLLNSHSRIYKALGYGSRQIQSLLDNFKYQEEAYLFTYQGQLYCDTFSLTKGTMHYAEKHNALNKKVTEARKTLIEAEKIINAHQQGMSPNDIAEKFYRDSFHHALTRSSKGQSEWEDYLFRDCNKDAFVQHEVGTMIKEAGSWENYIEELKHDCRLASKELKSYEKQLGSYEQKVVSVIAEILKSPFSILGL